MPIQSTNPALSSIDSKYVSQTTLLNNYDYDYSILQLKINDYTYRTITLLPGWTEQYIEVDTFMSENMKIEISRVDSKYPIFVHDVSIQQLT